MKILRNQYLDKLISLKHNGMIKIVTGLRRVGKSYLLNKLFFEHLLKSGVDRTNIISLSLEGIESEKFKNNVDFYNFLKKQIRNDEMHYFIIDEIQAIKNFEKALMSLMKFENVDIYVTGSNSKFLSSDIITEFRGRGYVIHISPLSYKEIFDFYLKNSDEYIELISNDKMQQSWKIYELYEQYGGLPKVVLAKTIIEKKELIKSYFENIYYNDIFERYKIKNKTLFESIVQIIAKNIGNILNLNKIQKLMESEYNHLNYETVERYVKILEEAFLIYKVNRYDYKNSKIIKGYAKYYFSDLGIKNHIVGFNNIGHGFTMENMISNTLKLNNADLKVGYILTSTLDENKKIIRTEKEIDFICNYNSKIFYIQSCYDLNRKETHDREIKAFNSSKNDFKKIILTESKGMIGITEKGIHIIYILDFLMNMKKILN